MFISVFKNDLVNKYLNVSILSFHMGSISYKQKKSLGLHCFFTLLNDPETKMFKNRFSEPSYQDNVVTFA